MYVGKELRGLLYKEILRCSMLFFLQNSSSSSPDEKQIILQSRSLADFTMLSVSIVFPDALVATTRVFELTVFGNKYPFTTVTWIEVFDKTERNKSPIAPEPPIPAKTICSMPSKFTGTKSERYASLANFGHKSYILCIPVGSNFSKLRRSNTINLLFSTVLYLTLKTWSFY